MTPEQSALGSWTCVALSRNDQLRLIGNGCVPRQGVAALSWLLADLAVERAVGVGLSWLVDLHVIRGAT